MVLIKNGSWWLIMVNDDLVGGIPTRLWKICMVNSASWMVNGWLMVILYSNIYINPLSGWWYTPLKNMTVSCDYCSQYMEKHIYIWRFPENVGTPSHHPILFGIFNCKPSSLLGTPILRILHIYIIYCIYICIHISHIWVIFRVSAGKYIIYIIIIIVIIIINNNNNNNNNNIYIYIIIYICVCVLTGKKEVL